MGNIKTPLQVKLFIGLLSSDEQMVRECTSSLTSMFGPVDLESDPVPWEHTDYYTAEMGCGLMRKFLFFKGTVSPDILPFCKLFTVTLERCCSSPIDGRDCRRINVDPGYVTEAKVVLATSKDFAHRISIGEGVYAEVTLKYNKKARSFETLEHTYPDFRTTDSLALFNNARRILRGSMKHD